MAKTKLNSEWQIKWETSPSMLHDIKEGKSTHNSYRQFEVKLSRLCIGIQDRFVDI